MRRGEDAVDEGEGEGEGKEGLFIEDETVFLYFFPQQTRHYMTLPHLLSNHSRCRSAILVAD